MNDFYHSIIQTEFPDSLIKFKDESILHRILSWMNRRHSNCTSVSPNRDIWFSSRKFYMESSNETINEILAHEYVHLVQASRNSYHHLLGLLPEILGLVILMVVGCMIGTFGFTPLLWIGWALGAFLMLPIAPLYRLKCEMEAYQMSILARVAQWNGKFKLPKSHYDMFQMSDAMVRDIIDGLFSDIYHAQWAPKWLKEKYFKRLKTWRNQVTLKYFVERLAFEKGNTYIEPTSDIYTRTLRYFIKSNARQ